MKDDLLDSILQIKYGSEPQVISGNRLFIVQAEHHWRSQEIRKYQIEKKYICQKM